MLEKARGFGGVLTTNLSCLRAAIGAIAYLGSTEVLAASSGTQAQNPAGAGLAVLAAIAYLSRRRAIGGWLLCFYIQLSLSLVVSLLFVPQVISNLSPSKWDSAMRYVLFCVSTIPVLMTQGFEAFAAAKLLRTRSEGDLRFLRKVLFALLVTSATALGIDMAYFADASTFILEIQTLVFVCIWNLYFWRATRVRLVFIEKAWSYTAYSANRLRTSAERKYLQKRAAIAGTATFIVVLLIIGAAIGETKPDAGIFVTPLFCALVAIAIAVYAPIAKKKRDALLNGEASTAASEQREGRA